MWGLVLRGLGTAGGRSAGVGEIVVTQGGKTIATEAAKGMAAIVLAKEVSKDITKQQRCNKCEPYQLGNKHQIKRPMGNEINTQYQIKIANLSSYPLTFKASAPYLVPGNKKQTTEIQEWTLAGVSFDGLWPMECILVEAKGRYEQFLDPKKKEFIRDSVYKGLVKEAQSQRVVKNRFKTAKLNWYFYEQAAKRHFDIVSRRVVTTIFMPL
ncbi:hypothetical protein AMD27_17865 (plasmid) [Acinetobacter sp. TGL-Y2]|uniref:Tox-REase-5 domain-containing protein n=1 Tax=Acinetobacter sp. TGL-Y2 TaxID=1407071 RepID=UPI0007A65768|nr:Tox-REase-5 domain-containing protein [Acinetobacter sp. TGL-Y2]AMW80792.1 hypothetical protein AMD27_17865 [Acinetobacter sp. TGL-Y2]